MQLGARALLVPPMPLPPEVAKGTTVLPVRSQLSRKVLTIVGAIYHQMGKPTNTTSYCATSAEAAMAGRLLSPFISRVLRLEESFQFRSAAV